MKQRADGCNRNFYLDYKVLVPIVAACLFLFSCQKEAVDRVVKKEVAINAGNNDSIMTPVGLMKAENVHMIGDGNSILFENGRAYKINTITKKKIEDLGKIESTISSQRMNKSISSTSTSSNFSSTTINNSQIQPPSGGSNGGNWVTYSQWYSNSAIMKFNTNWIVPANPSNNTGQLIYIWNGISPGPSSLPLIQPVLQWGSNGNTAISWGGQYWSMANWCIFSNQSAAISAHQINIPVGTNLQGTITCTGQYSNGAYNYTSAFTGYNNLTLNVSGSQYSGILNNAYEVLEVPNSITSTAQYPNQDFIKMSNISLYTGTPSSNSPAPLSWTSNIGENETLNEHTVIISNNSSGSGEVDIYFRNPPPPPSLAISGFVNGSGSFCCTQNYNFLTTTSGSGTIVGPAGSTVHLGLAGYGNSGTHQLQFSLSGAQLTGPMGNNVTINNGQYPTQTFTMPSSQSVSWTASYTIVGASGPGSISVY